MTKRTDVHRPSVIDPRDYEFVGFRPNVSFGMFGADFQWLIHEREKINKHMENTGGRYSTHRHGGTCSVCGVFALSTVVWYHAKSNSYIHTGETCAEKMAWGTDEQNKFNLFKSSVTNQWKALAGKNKAMNTLMERGLEQCWELYAETDNEARAEYKWEEHTISDIVSRLVRYGDLSERQWAFLTSLPEKIEKRQEVMEIRKAEHDAADPLPDCSKRFNIEGEVLSVKDVESYYGIMSKMLVKHKSGWKVYGTVPSSLEPLKRGSIVSFDAKVQPSTDDSKFGFFSRPTKAYVVKEPKEEGAF